MLSGKHIVYNSPEPATYIDTLTKAGSPPAYAEMFAGFAEAMKQGEFTTTTTDLETF